MEIVAKNPNDNKKVIEQIKQRIIELDINIVLFKGILGAGKTTLISELVHNLGFENLVSSPTFVIEKRYKKSKADSFFKEIHHLDLYRLNSNQEAKELIDKEELNNKKHLFLIEWPDIVIDLFSKYILVSIEVEEETRKFDIKTFKN